MRGAATAAAVLRSCRRVTVPGVSFMIGPVRQERAHILRERSFGIEVRGSQVRLIVTGAGETPEPLRDVHERAALMVTICPGITLRPAGNGRAVRRHLRPPAAVHRI